MDGSGFDEASDARVRQGDHDSAGISFVAGSRDEALVDERAMRRVIPEGELKAHVAVWLIRSSPPAIATWASTS